MLRDSFAVFILSHRRPDRVYTWDSLKKGNYTGPIYIVVDNTDPTIAEYKERYGDAVIVFDKVEASKRTDTMDNLQDLGVVVFARNEVFRIAQDLGYRYMLVLDDDYLGFGYAMLEDGKKKERRIRRLDDVFEAYLQFLDESGAITVAFAQGGDFIGGGVNLLMVGHKRKVMNAFFFRTDRPMKFMGRLNEDANASVYYASRGVLALTIPFVRLYQPLTQTNEGGLTDAYLRLGTYVKSFYTVMLHPVGVSVQAIKQKYWRLHHHIDWEKVAVKIVPEEVKKHGEKDKANGRNH